MSESLVNSIEVKFKPLDSIKKSFHNGAFHHPKNGFYMDGPGPEHSKPSKIFI